MKHNHAHKKLHAIVLLLALSALPSSHTVSSESSETSNQILWLRTPGDGTLHHISSNGTLNIHDQYNGTLLSMVEISKYSEVMQERLPPILEIYSVEHNWSHIDGWAREDCSNRISCPSIIINGDYSSSSNALFLNICKVDYPERTDGQPGIELIAGTRAKLILCEFIDFDSEYNVTRYSKSNTDYAVTYPTENGTFRVFSNHTIEDPDSEQFGTILSLEELSILPYPLNDGEIWLSSNLCTHVPGSAGLEHQSYQEFFQMSRGNSTLSFSKVGGYSIDCPSPNDHSGGADRYRTTSTIYAGDGCWMRTPDLPDIWRVGSLERGYEYGFDESGQWNISSIPMAWFHIRLPRSSISVLEIPSGQYAQLPEIISVEDDLLENHSERISNESMVCSIQYGLGYSETSFGTLGRSLEYGQHPYDIDHESGVAYLVKCDWSIRKSGRDLGDGCKKISTFPEQISNLDWPPDWPSELPSDSGPSFDARNSGINLGIILFLIAVPIMVMFSTTANSFLSSTLGSLPLISKDAITRSHYSQWDVEKREIFRDATGIAGQGIIASVAGVIYATALLTAYVIYIVGVVVLYAIYAYLIISGVVLLALGYVAGIICFLPIILLAAIAG